MAKDKEIKLSFQINNETNSINTIVKHLSGNMFSRWTDFLSSEGEKEFRNRDDEFNDTIESKRIGQKFNLKNFL